MNDNNKSMGLLQHFLEQLALEEENPVFDKENIELKTENANLKAEIKKLKFERDDHRCLSDNDLENVAYLRANFIEERAAWYSDEFDFSDIEATEEAEADADEHFGAPPQ